MRRLYIFIFCISLLSACKEDTFNPESELINKTVVYCVLDTREDKQLVKIQRSFYPGSVSNSIGFKINDLNYKISLIDNTGKQYNLKDTVINELKNYKVYFVDKIKIQHDQKYNLVIYDTVTSDNLITTTEIPPEEKIIFFKYITHLGVLFYESNSEYYDFHIIREYEKIENGEKIKGFMEVPIDIIDGKPVYPSLRERFFPNKYVKFTYAWVGKKDSATYKKEFFDYASVNYPEGFSYSDYKRMYLLVYHFSESLSNFIMAGKGFNDHYSIRMDVQFWTNIGENGIGVFGAISVDTVEFQY